MIWATRLVFVAEFGSWRTRGDFHALDGARWKLRGKELALLIADRLAISIEIHLRVVSKGVEETIAIGRHTAGAVHDRLAEAAASN